MIDNQAEQRPIAASPTRGLPDVESKEIKRGRTTHEKINDVARPVVTVLGNLATSIASPLTGISNTTTTKQGPTWNSRGAFVWHVGFNTTGRSGWIVQDMANTWRAKDAASLSSSTTTPAGLDIVRLYRYAQSTWNSTEPMPIHFGSACP